MNVLKIQKQKIEINYQKHVAKRGPPPNQKISSVRLVFLDSGTPSLPPRKGYFSPTQLFGTE